MILVDSGVCEMVTNTNSRNRIFISQRQLTDQNDLPQIENELKKGQILFLKTGQFFEQTEVIKLKSTIDFLKKTCANLGGSIGRIGPDLLVLTPNENIKLY